MPRKRTLKYLLVVLALILIPIAVLVIKNIYEAYREEQIEEGIESVKEQIANDEFDESDIYDLEIDEVQKFARAAFEEYEDMVDDYPEPEFEILHEYEIRKEVYEFEDAKDLVITEWVIDNDKMDGEFEVKFKVSDAETVEILGTEKILKPDDEGVYSYLVKIKDQENDLNLVAKNRYNTSFVDLVITRPENQEEKQERLEKEQNQTAWENSRGGQLCKKYPDWTTNECRNVEDNLIWIGMSYEMLLEERGAPDSTNQSNYGYGNQWQWCWWYYDISCFYDDNDDGLIDAYN